MSVSGGRQVAPSIGGIRDDHLRRYEFAADFLGFNHVIDAASGVGYGSYIMATQGYCKIDAYEIDPEAVAYHRWHYRHDNVTVHRKNVEHAEFVEADVAVSFETIEHLSRPKKFLSNLHKSVPRILGSVPNQDVIPFDPVRHKYHKRHYTPKELLELLNNTGWEVIDRWSQKGKKGKDAYLSRSGDGQTIIFYARRK